MPLNGLVWRQSQFRVEEGGLDAELVRYGFGVGGDFIGAGRRQIDAAGGDLRRGRVGHGEEPIVNRRPEYIAVARKIFCPRRAGKTSEGAIGEPRVANTLGFRAVIPFDRHLGAGVSGANRRGRADDPFLGREMDRLRGDILHPDDDCKQIVGAGLKLLHQAHAAGQGFFGADAAVRSGQGESAVALQGLAAEQREGGRGRLGVERGDPVGPGTVLKPAADRLRIIFQFSEFQTATV